MTGATSPGYPRVDGHAVTPLVASVVGGPDGAPVPLDPDVADTWFVADAPAIVPAADEELVLRAGGLATVATVSLGDEVLLSSESMFATHAIDLGDRLRDGGRVEIHCQALAPLLAVPRRPRARWRSRIVRDNALRWFRTPIVGRAPGFAPGPATVGPWRPLWLEHRRRLVVEVCRVRAILDGDRGVVSIDAELRPLGTRRVLGVDVVVEGITGTVVSPLAMDAAEDGRVRVHGTATIEAAERWWPHTHGSPVRYAVRLSVVLDDGPLAIESSPVGFRTISAGRAADHDIERDGIDLHVNGVRVFARGALWLPLATPADRDPAADRRATLERVRDAGMNMLRLPGTAPYEAEAFHDECDELGILVWQDAAFANLDYPFADPAFAATATAEVTALLERIGGRPSTAVVCGNSEIEQQVAMLGLPAEQWRDPFFAETVPALVANAACDAIVVPSAPFGGERPFVPGQGIANYFGVGGYRRPLSDARLAGVRFASECLAFSNVPDDAAVARVLPDSPGDVVVHHPAWKAAVPRDSGTGWDFEDVRDHYLREAGIDPDALRRVDHARYLDRSRAITGELMAAVFGEWRRPASPSGGGLILWLRDLAPGAGWGILDDHGDPKVAYHHLRRALAPVAVWLTDEGLAGVAVHVANDRPTPLDARLRLTLARDGEVRVGDASHDVHLDPHDARTFDLETLLGGFVDASWSYRFGPPGQDVIVATLEQPADDAAPAFLSQAFLFPAGRPYAVLPADRFGLTACGERLPDGRASVTVRTRRVIDGVRIVAPGLVPTDDAFAVEPGGERRILLERGTTPLADDDRPAAGTLGWLTAPDLAGRLRIPLEAEA
jgi:beta-mannosidase